MRKECLCATSSTRWSAKPARPRKRAEKSWLTTAKTGCPPPRTPAPPKRTRGSPFRPEVTAIPKEPLRPVGAAGFLSSMSRDAGDGFPDEVKQILFRKRRTAQPALELVAALFGGDRLRGRG